MRAILKIAIPLALIFASTFIIAKFFGFLTIEQIQGWLNSLKEAHPLIIGIVVAGLLFADLFIAVPNLTILILGGYFLGATYGFAAGLVGTMSAGLVGYWLGTIYGERAIRFVLKDEKEREQLDKSFREGGFFMILFSRAVPILPEVTACLAGITKMRFKKFLAAWSLSAIPYTLIASYSGSISTLKNPLPAILTAITLTTVTWVCWYGYRRRTMIKNGISMRG